MLHLLRAFLKETGYCFVGRSCVFVLLTPDHLVQFPLCPGLKWLAVRIAKRSCELLQKITRSMCHVGGWAKGRSIWVRADRVFRESGVSDGMEVGVAMSDVGVSQG